jgi:hypothetical protein
MAVDDDPELTQEIMRRLEIDAQWVKHFDPTDVEGIAKARSAGRRAGRALRLKVITHQSSPEQREDERVVVIVAVNQDLPPEDKERLAERSRLLMDNMWKGILPD